MPLLAHLQVDLLVLRHPMLLVTPLLLPQVIVLVAPLLVLRLVLQVSLHLEPLVPRHRVALAAHPVDLHLGLRLDLQVVHPVIRLPVLRLVRHLQTQVCHQVAHQVLPPVVLLAHHLRIPQVEVLVRRPVMLQVAHPANPHLEVFTLVARHLTVLL